MIMAWDASNTPQVILPCFFFFFLRPCSNPFLRNLRYEWKCRSSELQALNPQLSMGVIQVQVSAQSFSEWKGLGGTRDRRGLHLDQGVPPYLIESRNDFKNIVC